MIEGLVYLVIYIIIVGLVIWLLTVLVDRVPMDESIRQVARIAITVIGILIVIVLLLQFLGIIGGRLPRLGGVPYVGEILSG